MGERIRQWLEMLPAQIRTLPPAKLFLILGGLGAVVALSLVSLLWMSGGTTHEVLYSQLSLEDAGAMTAKLRDMQIPYSIGGNGTTIMVPAPLVHETRLRLASEGLPQGGGAGFELLDKRSFGMTEFMQRLNYRRALQGELARTIMQLSAVQNARVHIVLPEKSLFIEHQEKPTASVVLKLAPGRRLSVDQVRGVAHLVGSSVEGLVPENVTVVDASGQILNRDEENTSFLSQSEAQLAYRQGLEQNLERRVQTLLERAVGKGKVLVRVSATLDFQHIERTEERFDADNPAIRSEQRNKEEGSGVGLWAIGVPGARSNVNPSDNNASQGKDPSSLARQSETINYELSKSVSKVVAPSGAIKQLSVAVLVDGTYQTGENDAAKTYTPRTAEELAKYQEIVKSAVGYNEVRGDRVEVANMPFEPSEDREAVEMAKEAQRTFWLHLGRYGVYVVLALLFFLFVGRPLVRWVTGAGELATAGELPRTVQEIEANMGMAGMLPEGEAEKLPELLKLTHKPTGQELRTQLAEFVRSEPERAVEVLRVWLRG
jgi:flagellar M-ring protein FliF